MIVLEVKVGFWSVLNGLGQKKKNQPDLLTGNVYLSIHFFFLLLLMCYITGFILFSFWDSFIHIRKQNLEIGYYVLILNLHILKKNAFKNRILCLFTWILHDISQNHVYKWVLYNVFLSSVMNGFQNFILKSGVWYYENNGCWLTEKALVN